jgi:hypothetical protein
MGTGYVRADTANNIANGNVIDADDLDNEFNAVEAAFNASTGHTHDGTTSEGAPIEVIGPAQDIVATTTVLRPKTTNTVDLGTSSLKYKDAYLAGDLSLDGSITSTGAVSLGSTAITGTLSVSTDTTLTGNLTANGNTTLGNAATDTVTVNADVASSLIPSVDDSYDLGAVGSEWRDAYIDGTAYIDTGSIDTANVATLNVSGNADVDGDLTVTGSINASITGTATQADTLTTARTISLAGDVAGAANFDGSANITITTVIADDSHNHTIANVDGLQAALDAKPDGLSDLGVTALSTELNLLDGVTATTVEINYLDGVTSNIQTQLDGKLTSFSLETYTGNVSIVGDVDIDGELVVTSYNETFVAVTSTSNATTINCEAGNVFSHSLSENTTFTFSNPPASGTAYGFSLKIVQDASNSNYVITWPTSVDWVNGSAPSFTSIASAVDQLIFYTHNGGTTWYGFKAGLNLG